ncbi:hypothetical protein M422DRAFT_26124 [Sphaerobolus stellatus SS14]|nr:hypothetical protein M422DRAFT_26124 [Sphaerobolus stellatus SS14]
MNFYQEAAKLLERLDAKKGSIKGIIGSVPEKSRKRTAALVIETLKYKDTLNTVIDASPLLKQERKCIPSRHLALLLVHDLLFARGGIQASDGPIKQAILRHKTRLQAELTKLKVKKGAKTLQELAAGTDLGADKIPRYVRVNSIRWNAKEAVAYLTVKGFAKGSSPFDSKKSFIIDEHISNLLAFHPSATFHDDEAYQDGRLILQDKASCFPAVVLSPPSRYSTVALDATAAPGNKTTHLGALMQNKGKLLAFERDKHRYRTLEKMVSKAACKVEARNMDFLTTDPHEPENSTVTHILLDPSCSGSGIVNRLDYLLAKDDENEQEQDERLEKLAAFQLSMITHAMKFPKVQKIVYSTCSIHAEENEQVVIAALKSEEAKSGHFKLAPRSQVIPTWIRRGIPEEMGEFSDLADSVIRCSPGEDATNGFFVACFIRMTGFISSPRAGLTASKRKADDDDLRDSSGEEKEPEVQMDKRGESNKKRKKRKKKRKEVNGSLQ